MWYVVQVVGGREKHVLRLIEKLVDGDVLKECFVAQYEVKKHLGGAWRTCTELLLPGYLFIISNDVGRLAEELRRVPAFTRLLGNSDAFIPLNNDEIAFISAFTDEHHRVVKTSEGIIEGDEITILKGPLMHREGLIKKINRHRRTAELELEMLGRTVTIKVGLEIVRKRT